MEETKGKQATKQTEKETHARFCIVVKERNKKHASREICNFKVAVRISDVKLDTLNI